VEVSGLRRGRILTSERVMAAPKPRPVALKLLEGRGHGRDSGGRKVAETPLFKRLPPEAPEWLPAEARAEWDRVVPELARLELTKPVDRAALTAYVLTWQRLVDASKLIAEHPDVSYVIKDLKGDGVEVDSMVGYGLLGYNSQGIVRAPWVAIIEAASKDLRAWCAEFGFTPSAEAKLSVQEADNGEEDIFSG
jgi:P27 family predicted phage terminase small subunit